MTRNLKNFAKFFGTKQGLNQGREPVSTHPNKPSASIYPHARSEGRPVDSPCGAPPPPIRLDLLRFLPLALLCGLGLRLKTLEPSELAAGDSPDPPPHPAPPPFFSVRLTLANLSPCVSCPCASNPNLD